MKILAFATASIALASTSIPAFANDTDGQSQTLKVSDLDLSTSEGQRILDERINSIAMTVCNANQSQTGTRMRSRDVRECLQNARASAKEQVAAMIEEQQRGG